MNVSAKETTATVRYQVTAVEPSVAFYTKQLDFKLDKSAWAVGPPTSHENRLPSLVAAARATSRVHGYRRVRYKSDVGAFGTPPCCVRARRAESCRGKLLRTAAIFAQGGA
jgi:hypothetical protein